MALSRLLIVCLFLGFTTHVFGSEKQDSLAALVEKLTKIESISGSFVQLTVDQKGVHLQQSKGDFKAKRPGKFFWSTSEPLEQMIYSDGDTVTIYDPDLEQATVQKISDEIQSTPAVLFSGDLSEIGKRFDVEMKVWDGQSRQFILTPKTQDSLFERMFIRFEGIQLAEMRLSDSLGQENSISFIQTQVNPDLSDQVFEPEFPEGTDVIRDLPMTSAPE